VFGDRLRAPAVYDTARGADAVKEGMPPLLGKSISTACAPAVATTWDEHFSSVAVWLHTQQRALPSHT